HLIIVGSYAAPPPRDYFGQLRFIIISKTDNTDPLQGSPAIRLIPLLTTLHQSCGEPARQQHFVTNGLSDHLSLPLGRNLEEQRKQASRRKLSNNLTLFPIVIGEH